MNRRAVFIFLVLGVAIFLAALTFLQNRSSVLEYSEIQMVAAQDCRETDIAIRDAVIDNPERLSDYTSDLMSRAGHDPRGILSGEYSHLGNSYVEGTTYCWIVAFSKPGDSVWTVLYEAKDGSVREFLARVH